MQSRDRPEPALSALLAGAEPDAFFSAHGHHAVVTRGASDRFVDLLSGEQAQALRSAAPAEHVEPIRSGVGHPGGGVPAAPTSSVRLLRVQTLDDRLAAFALRLVDALGEEINLNLYLSPPDATGLAPHADLYDVLVLQLGGAKRWALLGRGDGPDEPFETACGTVGELTLGAGDALFLPAGLTHRAHNPGPEPSVHLTVGIFTKSQHSIAEWLAAELQGEERERWLPEVVLGAGELETAIDGAHRRLEQLLTDPHRLSRFLEHRRVLQYERTLASLETHRQSDARIPR